MDEITLQKKTEKISKTCLNNLISLSIVRIFQKLIT